MRGLLRKELSGLWSLYRKTLPMIAVLYAVLNLVTRNDFFLYFGVWMMLFYSLSGMSLDESCGWGRYARTLPVNDWQVVGLTCDDNGTPYVTIQPPQVLPRL